MANKIPLLRHLRSVSIAARDFTLGLVSDLTEAIGEVANELPVSASVTLTSNGWAGNEQIVTINDVTATNTVIVSPAPESQDAYTLAEVYCTEQADKSLTFTCTDVPTTNITVNLVIIKG